MAYRWWALGVFSLFAALAVSAFWAASDARAEAPVPYAGALFRGSTSGPHSCSATVVKSASQNVIATAAHCLSGDARGMVFVPGYAGGRAPHGEWTVVAAYLSPGWLATQSPGFDYAFVTVTPASGNPERRPLWQVVGAPKLGQAPDPGTKVTITGYAVGRGDGQIVCDTVTETKSGVPAFTCGNFPDGTSGGPWIATSSSGPELVGVIGGLNQGGCLPETSYSSPFDSQTQALLDRAASGTQGDQAPAAGPNGC